MTFKQITKKNFNYQIHKFTSYFIVNVFVVSTLFLFGSLLFNETLNANPSVVAVRGLILTANISMVIFAIIFLSYTGFYFIRSRGHEFGIYLTLGMTSKDLSQMMHIEIMSIFVASALLGVAIALLLGNLFYLGLARLLQIPRNLFDIDYRVFVFSLGVLFIIFLIQLLVTKLFLRKLTIVEILKSTKTKNLAKKQPVFGVISLLLFILPSYLLLSFFSEPVGLDK